MPKFLQQAIIPLAAVIGAQLPNILIQPHPAQSTSCLKWASDAVDGATYNLQRTFNPPKAPEGLTEGEYNQYREVYKTDDIKVAPYQAEAPTTTESPYYDGGFQP